MRIQYVSDLHLEFYDTVPEWESLVKPCAKYLALPGDIAQPSSPLWKPFFDYVSSHWERVFYVTGNHEYYNKKPKHLWDFAYHDTWMERHEQIRNSLLSYPNIVLLDSTTPSYHLEEENVAIVGNTVWSYIPPEIMYDVEHIMNDYNYIALDRKRAIKAEHTNEWHIQQRKCIQEEILKWTERKVDIVVLTHHMPSFALIHPRYKGSIADCAFASDSEELMLASVKAWIYGHTHNVDSRIIGTTQVVVNARGYRGEVLEGFRTEAYVEFPTSFPPVAVSQSYPPA